jgi:polar amino acid transport system permease protein
MTTTDAGPATAGEVKAVPVRHLGRTVAAVVVAVLALGLLWSLGKNPNLDWPTIGHYLLAELTLRGVLVTIELTVVSMLIGIVGGVVVAIMRLSDNYVLRYVAIAYVWFFRGTPVLVQIIFWGYLGAFYPTTSIGIPFTDITFFSGQTSALVTATTAAILGLGLNEIAYAAEIVRGGIQSVSPGQREAAASLGLSAGVTMRKVVLPQAMRVIVPPMGNEVITMLKTTALVSVIAGKDLLTNLQQVYSQNFRVIPLLVVASLWYLALVTVLGLVQSRLERRFGRGFSAARPARPAAVSIPTDAR